MLSGLQKDIYIVKFVLGRRNMAFLGPVPLNVYVGGTLSEIRPEYLLIISDVSRLWSIRMCQTPS